MSPGSAPPHHLPHVELPDPVHALGLDKQAAPTVLGQSLIDSIGGRRGVIDGTVPTIVFAAYNVAAGLTVGLIAAAALGVVLTIVRLTRRQPVRQAVSGLLGLAIACLWALHSHKATGFYLPGILLNGAYALAFLGSIAVRRPLVGVVAGLIDHAYVGWRNDRRLRRAMDLATAMWGVYYAASFGARLALYETGHATTLAALKIVLGYPATLGLIGLSLLIAKAGAKRPQTDVAGTGGALNSSAS